MTDLARDIDRLYQRVDQGFTALNGRLDDLNGRTRDAEQDIAVLKDRSAESRKGGYVGGGIVAGIAALAELARHYFTK